MKLLVLNDTHIGVRRTSGTTHASQDALRVHILEQHTKHLDLAVQQGCD
jgi:hypothetical protein